MLEALKGQFWTREEELIEDVEVEGFEVVDIDYEHLIVVDENDVEHVFNLVRSGMSFAIGDEVIR